MACRDSKKADQAAKEIIKLTNNMSVNVEYLDLADLETVRSFAQKMNESLSQLDILVNNAGVMQCPYWKSAQGIYLKTVK
jgi:NAD(P)-dependent dehydrogenase (short-subunit alcohol dehydrogenase family)